MIRVPSPEELIRQWRRRISWAAVGAVGICGACGGPGLPATETGYPAAPETQILRAPIFEQAAYYAIVTPASFQHTHSGGIGPAVVAERDGFACGPAIGNRDSGWQDQVQDLRERIAELNAQRAELNHPDIEAEFDAEIQELEADVHDIVGDADCPPDLFAQITDRAGHRGILLRDAEGNAQFLDDAGGLLPIDAPWKAALAVWFHGNKLEFRVDAGRWGGGFRAPHVRAIDGGYAVVVGGNRSQEIETDDRHPCEVPVIEEDYQVRLRVAPDGTITELDRRRVHAAREINNEECHNHGRRPEQFVDVCDTGTLRSHFARAMHHEAESVRAFERLAHELRTHGAPEAFAREAEAAAQDERKHAEMYQALGAAFGYSLPLHIEPNRGAPRMLTEIAIENAREGAAYETFAAAIAVHQSAHASTSALRAHYSEISQDELRHAALAHAIHEWAIGELSASDQTELRQAHAQAWVAIGRAIGTPSPVEQFVGHPSAAQQHAIASTMQSA